MHLFFKKQWLADGHGVVWELLKSYARLDVEPT